MPILASDETSLRNFTQIILRSFYAEKQLSYYVSGLLRDSHFSRVSEVHLDLFSRTAGQTVDRKRDATPEVQPQIFERLKIKPAVWCKLVTRFGKLFSLVAGQPHRVDQFRGRLRKKRYHVRHADRERLSA